MIPQEDQAELLEAAGLDPEALAALPPDMRREVLEQVSALLYTCVAKRAYFHIRNELGRKSVRQEIITSERLRSVSVLTGNSGYG